MLIELDKNISSQLDIRLNINGIRLNFIEYKRAEIIRRIFRSFLQGTMEASTISHPDLASSNIDGTWAGYSWRNIQMSTSTESNTFHFPIFPLAST